MEALLSDKAHWKKWFQSLSLIYEQKLLQNIQSQCILWYNNANILWTCSIVVTWVQSNAATNQTDQNDEQSVHWSNCHQLNSAHARFWAATVNQQNWTVLKRKIFHIVSVYATFVMFHLKWPFVRKNPNHSSAVTFPAHLQYSEYKHHECINSCWTCLHWRREVAPEFPCRASSWRWVCRTAAAGWRRSFSRSRSAEAQADKRHSCSQSRDGIEPATSCETLGCRYIKVASLLISNNCICNHWKNNHAVKNKNKNIL